MPTWIGKALNWGKGVASAWKSAPVRARDSTVLGRGVFQTTFDILGSSVGRIAVGAGVGGAIGAATADSNTAGGTARGFMRGAIAGGGLGLLTSPGFWSVAHDVAGRPMVGMARGALNRFAGNPIGRYKSLRAAGAGKVDAKMVAGVESIGAMGAASMRRGRKMQAAISTAAGPLMGFATRHPNLAAGGVITAGVVGTFGAVASGETKPTTGKEMAVAATGEALRAPQEPPRVREHYQTLQSSTEGLVFGLHQGRHS
jgi:hypothetical protein